MESRDEEITSDEEDLGVSSAEEDAPSEDEYETVQEKKVRLAKVYLEEIEKQGLALLLLACLFSGL